MLGFILKLYLTISWCIGAYCGYFTVTNWDMIVFGHPDWSKLNKYFAAIFVVILMPIVLLIIPFLKDDN